jgi:predicted nucleotidyltransferase
MSNTGRTADETTAVQSAITEVLARHPSIVIAVLFGSLAADRAHRESDLDLAIASTAPIPPEIRIQLIDELAVAIGRPVDLIDLDRAHNPLLQQVLTHGRLLLCHDQTRYAELIRRMVYEEADVMPYYRRILAERRQAWIGR